jgi:hypothetical protein
VEKIKASDIFGAKQHRIRVAETGNGRDAGLAVSWATDNDTGIDVSCDRRRALHCTPQASGTALEAC